MLYCCFTSTEARWLIRDGDRVGKGRQSEGSTAETVRKRLERPWTAAGTMEVLRRCPLAIAQRLVHCAIAVSTAVLDRVTNSLMMMMMMMNWCLMSSDVMRHIRDKSWPMPKHGAISLYVHGNQRLVRTDSPGRPRRLSHSSWTMLIPWLRTNVFRLPHTSSTYQPIVSDES